MLTPNAPSRRSTLSANTSDRSSSVAPCGRRSIAMLAGALAGMCALSTAHGQVATGQMDGVMLPVTPTTATPCPNAQPSDYTATPLWYAGNPNIAQSCDAGRDGTGVDLFLGYFGIAFLEDTGPDRTPLIGPDIQCGVAYNSGTYVASGSSNVPCASGTSTSTPAATCSPVTRMWLGPKFFLTGRPQLTNWTASSTNYVRIYTDGKHMLQFKETASGSNVYAGINGSTGAVEFVDPGTNYQTYWKYHDRSGACYWYFGADLTITRSGVSYHTNTAGQLWKITYENGLSAGNQPVYQVGATLQANPSADDAYTGFEQCGSSPVQILGRVATSFDSSGRKYEFTYDSSSGQLVNQQISAPSSGPLLYELNYTYYASSSNGVDGTLEAIEHIQYLQPGVGGGSPVSRFQYFRYYTGGSTIPEYSMKMVLDAEGIRQWAKDNTITYPGSVLANIDSASDNTLKPYASTFVDDYYFGQTGGNAFKNGRVKKITVNGACSCAGSTTTTEYDYTLSSSVSDTNTSYECSGSWWSSTPKWLQRTKAKNADGTYALTYFDDTGQVLASIKCAIDPDGTGGTGSGQTFWATVYERDASTRITRVYSPETVASYDHSTGAFTFDHSKGVVRNYVYSTDTNLAGNVIDHTEINDGTSGTGSSNFYVEANYLYDSSGYTATFAAGTTSTDDVVMGIPRLARTRVFKQALTPTSGGLTTASNFDETSYATAIWSSAPPWAIESVTTTLPSVDTGENGSGSSPTTERWFDQKTGKLVFSQDAGGHLTFFEWDSGTGQATRQVDLPDAGISGVSTAAGAFTAGPTIPGSGASVNVATTLYAYDDAGRPTEVTLPSGRKTFTYYTTLIDSSPVILSGPAVSGTTFSGPAGYTVLNLASRTTAQATLELGSSNQSTSIGSWVGTGTSDPIGAINNTYATVKRFSSRIYDSSGSRLLSSRLYSAFTSSTTSGVTYDETSYVYDSMGRVVGVKDPTGTIRRSEFDSLGRTVKSLIGTNDNGSTPAFSTSGTANTTKTDESAFLTNTPTSGSYKLGTTRLASRTQDADGDWSGTGDQRVTTPTFDYRGRLLKQTYPPAPITLNKYDFRGRLIASATYKSSSSVAATADPVGSSSGDYTDRLSASETAYDGRGQVWRTLLHKVSQSAGTFSSGDDLASLNWYDAEGQLLKTVGPAGLLKYTYDDRHRQTIAYTLAKTNDTAYGDADDVTGDLVLEQRHTVYDPPSSDVLWTMSLARVHHDTSTTGPIDSTGQPNASLSRAQITATWYDTIDRPVTTANYGTNGSGNGSSFTYPTAPTSSSSSVLVSLTAYNKDGSVASVTDPMGKVTAFEYDLAGRKITSIANKTSSPSNLATADRDNDLYTRYVYGNGLLAKMWVDLDGDNTQDSADQLTEYVYGTTRIGTGESIGAQVGSSNEYKSLIATGHLLRTVIHPPQDAGTQTAPDWSVHYAYNALSEQGWTKDQNGTILTTTYDTAGRQTARIATATGTGIDTGVLRISLAYTDRSQISTVTQHTNTAGTSPYNEVGYTYDDWGNVSQIDQDPDGVVGAGGMAAFSVQFGYTRVAPASGSTIGRTSVRRTSITYPDGWVLNLNSGSGSFDDYVGRVASLTYTPSGGSASSNRVEYQYLGAARLVSTYDNEPNIASRLHDSATTAAYDRLDRFDRITQSDWAMVGIGSFYDTRLSYDYNSNITLAEDKIFRDASDVLSYSNQFTMDAVNRVAQANRGEWNSGTPAIQGSNRWNEVWELSQTGNWSRDKIDINGNNNFSDTGEFNETRTHNNANGILTRSTLAHSPAEDKSGQMIDDGKNYEYVYDAFGRMRKVYVRDNATGISGNHMIEYRYDGLGQRVGWRYDTNNSGAIDSSDPWYHFAYDDRWRTIATYRGNSAHNSRDANSLLKERFIHHAAGKDGLGGSSYVDTMAWMDRDLNSAWTSAGDGTLETRHYTCQNWRADMVSVMADVGGSTGWLPARHYRYTAYGRHIEYEVGDIDRDGFFDSFDMSNWAGTVFGSGAMLCDLLPDGFVDFFDDDAINDLYANGSNTDPSLCGGIRHLYAGYELDPATSLATELYHVRHRAYAPELGRWTRRDPRGYADGMTLYAYGLSDPLIWRDPMGLRSVSVDDDCKGSISEMTYEMSVIEWSCPKRTKKISTFQEILDDLEAQLKSEKACCIDAIYLSAHSGVCGNVQIGEWTIDPDWIRHRDKCMENPKCKKEEREAKYLRWENMLKKLVGHLCDDGFIEFVQCNAGEGDDGEFLSTYLKRFLKPKQKAILHKTAVRWFFGYTFGCSSEKKCEN